MTLDVVVSGLGGQGVLTFARTLARAALREGYDAHFLVQAGLAQLGSPVLAHVRIGLPAGSSPKVPRGRATVGVALEQLEALRLAPYLSPDARVIGADAAVRPYEARFRKGLYPSREQVEAGVGGSGVLWVPAEELARLHGPASMANAVMLGAFSGISAAVERDCLVAELRAGLPEMADAEAEAFFEGYGFVTGLYE